MIDFFKEELFKKAVVAFEILAVVVLLSGVVLFTVLFLKKVFRMGERHSAYREFRLGIGRTLLLTLDLLVAADIVMTVTVDLNFETLGMLGLLMIIRTFLHLILELEVSGRFPWQHHAQAGETGSGVAGSVQSP